MKFCTLGVIYHKFKHFRGSGNFGGTSLPNSSEISTGISDVMQSSALLLIPNQFLCYKIEKLVPIIITVKLIKT